MVAAVAAGALVAASQTLEIPAAAADDAVPGPQSPTTSLSGASLSGASLSAANLSAADLAETTTAETTALASSRTIAHSGSGPSFAPEVLPPDTDAAALDLRALGKAGELAAKLAAESATPKPGEPYVAGDNSGLDGWIAQSLGLLGLPQSLAPGVKKIIFKESGGNPQAINLSDSNARAGHPSQGLMQLIPQTFREYVPPGLRNRSITDPVANITAGLRYMIQNYGVSTVAGGGRHGSGGGYVGY